MRRSLVTVGAGLLAAAAGVGIAGLPVRVPSDVLIVDPVATSLGVPDGLTAGSTVDVAATTAVAATSVTTVTMPHEAVVEEAAVPSVGAFFTVVPTTTE